MRIVQVTRFGDPEVLVPTTAPDPIPGPGEVLVEVSVAAVDFVQTQLRSGVTPGPPLPELPYVPGASVAGVVGAVGDGVAPGWIGRRVVTHTVDRSGGNAELAVAAVGALIPVPSGLGLPEAAALLDDGATALGLVRGAEVRAGDRVLVEAAAGGVGSLLVQLAVAVGARVVAAAHGPRKLDLARRLGADPAVDYGEPDWTRQVLEATGGAGVDVVFDGVGGRTGGEAITVTRRGGRFSVHGAASGSVTVVDPADAERRGIQVIGLEQLMDFPHGARERTEWMLAEAAAGRLRPVIGATWPLARAADAHAAMQARAVVGKTLLAT